MSKLSDFFKSPHGRSLKAALVVSMASTPSVVSAEQDGVLTYDERTGYEHSVGHDVKKMKAQADRLEGLVLQMSDTVTHCELVTNRLSRAFPGISLISESSGFTPTEKLEAIGKIAQGLLNDPLTFSDYKAATTPGFTAPVEEAAFEFRDMVDQYPDQGIDLHEIRNSLADKMDHASEVLGALQEELDACSNAVSGMIDGYGSFATAAPAEVADPEVMISLTMGNVSSAYHQYMDYIDHAHQEAPMPEGDYEYPAADEFEMEKEAPEARI